MRRALLGFLLIALGTAGCGSDPDTPAAPEPTARLTVFVYWQNAGVPDKHVEVLEAHLWARTDADGLVHFAIPPGEYTLRIHELGVPGPGRPWMDFPFRIRGQRAVRIEVLDCQLCV